MQNILLLIQIAKHIINTVSLQESYQRISNPYFLSHLMESMKLYCDTGEEKEEQARLSAAEQTSQSSAQQFSHHIT